MLWALLTHLGHNFPTVHKITKLLKSYAIFYVTFPENKTIKLALLGKAYVTAYWCPPGMLSQDTWNANPNTLRLHAQNKRMQPLILLASCQLVTWPFMSLEDAAR